MTMRTPIPAPPLHDAALWLIGAPAAALLAAYAWATAPALSADAPDQIIAVVLACALGALIAWNLLWSAIAHAAAAGRAPGALRRALARAVARAGTRHSRAILARAGASAVIGGITLAGIPLTGAVAAAAEPAAPAALPTPAAEEGARAVAESASGLDLTWAGPAGAAEAGRSPSTAGAPSATPPAPSAPASEGPATAPGASPTAPSAAPRAAAPTPASQPSRPAPGPRSAARPDSPAPLAPDPGTAPDGRATVTVRPGDTLWSITAAALPSADDAQIADAWPRLYEANADTIGPDPSLLLPGQVLAIPEDLS